MAGRFCPLWDAAITAACEEHGWTLPQLAPVAGVTQRTLSQSRRYGPNRKYVGLATVKRVAEAGNLSATDRHALFWAWLSEEKLPKDKYGKMVLAILKEYEKLAPPEEVAMLQRHLIESYPADELDQRQPKARVAASRRR